MREIIDLLESKNRPDDLELVDVNYTNTSLQPVISSGSYRYHRELAQAYATRYNSGEGDPQFNYSGLILHNIWFTQFRAPRPKNDPNGPIGGMIRSKFGSYASTGQWLGLSCS